MLLSFSTIDAQQTKGCQHELKGLVLDIDTKEPLPFVQVKVKETAHFAITNINGQFHIEGLCNEFNTLIISCYGYCNTTCEHYHQHSKNPHIYIKKDVHALETVTITAAGDKKEGTASIAQKKISKIALAEQQMQTLASAVSEVAGVNFSATGTNIQLPIIHGLYGNRILTLNSGMKHGFQNWGTDHAPEIDISSANSISVVKGASGVRYGPEAIGGAIIVETAPLYLNEAFASHIGSGYQSNGKGYFVHYDIAEGFEKLSYHLGANYTRVGDRYSPEYSLTNSGKEEKSVNGSLRYRIKNWDFKGHYSYVNQNLALLRASIAESGNAFVNAINADQPIIITPFSYDINEPRQATQHHLGKAEITWYYSDDAKLKFRYGKQLNKRKEFDLRRNAEIPIIDLDLITNDSQLEWTHPDWKQLDGTIGIQRFTQNNDNNPGTGTTPFIPNYNTLRYSGYIIESLKKDKHLFETGIRLDYEYNNVRGRETNQDIFRDEYSFANLSFSLGYVREIGYNTTFRSNFASAWRSPNMAELYSFGQHGFKTSFGLLRYYSNENDELRTDKVTPIDESDIAPEKGYKWINEWATEKETNRYMITAYAHFIENFIFDRPMAVIGTIRGPMPVFVFDQTDAVFVGTDLTWQKDWSSTLNGALTLSYLWSKNLKKDEALFRQPPITMKYKFLWETKKRWKFDSTTLSITPSYTFQQFQAARTIRPEALIDGSVVLTPDSEIFDFKAVPSAYFLLDISWRFKIKQFEASLSVQNVFNNSYRNYLNDMRYFADELARNFLFTINYTLNKKSRTK